MERRETDSSTELDSTAASSGTIEGYSGPEPDLETSVDFSVPDDHGTIFKSLLDVHSIWQWIFTFLIVWAAYSTVTGVYGCMVGTSPTGEQALHEEKDALAPLDSESTEEVVSATEEFVDQVLPEDSDTKNEVKKIVKSVTAGGERLKAVKEMLYRKEKRDPSIQRADRRQRAMMRRRNRRHGIPTRTPAPEVEDSSDGISRF